MSRQDKIVDPFLQKVLEQHRGQSEFSDILRSIQEEQNDIVDFDFDKNIIVQGCAGSGKTMILFHRLANILYNLDAMSKPIRASQIAVIIPNDSFKKYLENLTWSLGVDKIRMMTFDEYLKTKIYEIILHIFKSEDIEMIGGGHNVGNKSRIDPFMRNRIMNAFEQESTNDNDMVKFNKESVNDIASFVESYQNNLRKMIIERTEEQNRRIERLRPSDDRSAHKKWLEKSMELIRDFREDSLEYFYTNFLSGKSGNRGYLLGFINAICNNDELSRYKPSSDSLLMIDEGQDYSMSDYKGLKTISPNCIFNIFGDTDQKVFDRGLENWSEIKDLFQADYFTLNQDYRNSNQIVDYVNSTLGKNIMPIGFDTKDVEEVELKKLPVYLQYERNILKHKIAIVTDQPNFYAKVPEDVTVLSVQQIKGLEFDAVFISPEIQSLNKNFRYVALTRALSDLYILK